MTTIDQMISSANQAIAYGDSVDIFQCLVGVKDQLQELQSKLKNIDGLHRSFLEKYYTATEISSPEWYFQAALAAKSLQFEMKRIGILPNLDEDIRDAVVKKIHG